MLRASRNGQSSQFIVRKLIGIHTCDLKVRLKDQRQVTATIIADMIKINSRISKQITQLQN